MSMISIDGASTDCGKRRKCWLQKKERNGGVLKLSLKLEIFPLYCNSIGQCLHAISVLDTLGAIDPIDQAISE